VNLTKLYETQKTLDERIIKEKGLEGQDLLPEKILALLTELGELSNEWRGFKFWSIDRNPRLQYFEDYELPLAEVCGLEQSYPLLEEFVDCIHFFISIALELEIDPEDFVVTCDYTQSTTTKTFNRVFSTVSSLDILMDESRVEMFTAEDIQQTLHEAFSCFVGLGEKFLCFTWEQVETAYFAKNAINHTRQDMGY